MKFLPYYLKYFYFFKPIHEVSGGSALNLEFFLLVAIVIIFCFFLYTYKKKHEYLYAFLLVNIFGFISCYFFLFFVEKLLNDIAFINLNLFLIEPKALVINLKFLSFYGLVLNYTVLGLILTILFLFLLCWNLIFLARQNKVITLLISIGYFLIPIIYSILYTPINDTIITIVTYSLILHLVLFFFMMLAAFIIIFFKKKYLKNKIDEKTTINFWGFWCLGSMILFLWINAYALNTFLVTPGVVYELSTIMVLGGYNLLYFLILYLFFILYLRINNNIKLVK